MRVAITGGTGFVGRHLARALVARGHEAVLVARGQDVRDASIYKLSKTSFVKSDLCDPQELRRAFLGCDAVAHCAGINPGNWSPNLSARARRRNEACR
jgi:nucleoside-diphosphate-sugar epimerase